MMRLIVIECGQCIGSTNGVERRCKDRVGVEY